MINDLRDFGLVGVTEWVTKLLMDLQRTIGQYIGSLFIKVVRFLYSDKLPLKMI